ncbi:MAG: hypothetical protein ABFD76_05175 [Smithella sp.]
MQQLTIKNTRTGKSRIIHVLRSWFDGAGKQIHLLADGRYADAQGHPLKSDGDFSIMPQHHRKVALLWWNRRGKNESREYFEALDRQQEAAAGDYQAELAEAENNTLLDAVLYYRKKGKTAASKAQSWMEFGFPSRPDWWGQAKEIKFKDYNYVMIEPDADENGTAGNDEGNAAGDPNKSQD